MEVLAELCRCAGIEFDPVHARQAWQAAEREIPGPFIDAWQRRLAQAGEELGLRVTAVRRPLGEAIGDIKPHAPIVLAAGPDESPRWFVLTERRWGKLHLATGVERWITRTQLEEVLEQPADAPVLVAVAHAASPCEGMRDPEADLHDHGHGGPSPFRRLLRLLRPELLDLGIVAVYSLAIGILMLATPLAVETLVNSIAFGGLLQPVVVVSLMLLGGLGFAAVLQSLQRYVIEIVQRRIFVRVVADLAYRLPRVRIDAFDGRHGPELVNRFFDVLTVQKVSAALVLDGLSLIITSFVGMSVMAFYHPFLLGYDLVLLAAIAFILFVLGRGAVRTSIEESRRKYDVAACLEEFAARPMAFRLSRGQLFAYDRADMRSRDYILARREHFRILFRQLCFAYGLQALAGTALLGLGGWLVVNMQLSLGQLVAAELIVTTIVASFAKMGKHIEGFYDLMAAVEKLGILMDLPLEDDHGEAIREGGGPAALRLKDVGFAFIENRPVLENLELDVAPGQKVAIVGRSGSGKSTLVELLIGLRSPTIGSIEIDGLDLRHVRKSSLREAVAAVFDSEAFHGTIAENVRVGRQWMTLADVRDALDAVGLLETVLEFPDGLYTEMVPGGSPLSDGQMYRLMLARAIAGAPRLLLLDEALDRLDYSVRDRVLEMIFSPDAPWTVLVTTHSREVSRRCSRRYTLTGGRLEERDALDPAPSGGS